MNLSEKKRKELEKKHNIRIPEKDIKLKGGINAHLLAAMDYNNPEHDIKPYKEIKKELGLKDADVAEMFGYANANSFRTSKAKAKMQKGLELFYHCLLYTSPSPRDQRGSRMPSSA